MPDQEQATSVLFLLLSAAAQFVVAAAVAPVGGTATDGDVLAWCSVRFGHLVLFLVLIGGGAGRQLVVAGIGGNGGKQLVVVGLFLLSCRDGQPTAVMTTTTTNRQRLHEPSQPGGGTQPIF